MGSMPIAVLMQRRTLKHVWADEAWEAVGVLPDRGDLPPVQMLSQTPERDYYLVSGLELELYPDENEGYYENVHGARIEGLRAVAHGGRPRDAGARLGQLCRRHAHVRLRRAADGVTMPADIYAWVPATCASTTSRSRVRPPARVTMSDEGFLRRWARRKLRRTEERRSREPGPPPPAALVAPGAAPKRSLPLRPPPMPPPPAGCRSRRWRRGHAGPDSDFSAFVARGVDQAVRRGALKKLFADPHFNVMDRLDVYIDDYTQAEPHVRSDAGLARAREERVHEDGRGRDAEDADAIAVRAAAGEPETTT
jgi:hypothetical protein